MLVPSVITIGDTCITVLLINKSSTLFQSLSRLLCFIMLVFCGQCNKMTNHDFIVVSIFFVVLGKLLGKIQQFSKVIRLWFWRFLLLYVKTGMFWCVIFMIITLLIRYVIIMGTVGVLYHVQNIWQKMHWSIFV